MSIRTNLVFAAIGIALNAGSSNAQDLCKFLPEHPQILSSATREVPLYPGGCFGAYWPRVQTPVFYDLAEFDITIMIWPTQGPTDAKALAAKYQKGRPPTSTYGDGAWETMEDPHANDQYVRDPRSLANRVRGGTTPQEMLSRKPYFNIFTCGNLIVSITSNPSKGPAARDLAKELDSNLRSAGLCAASPAAVVVNNNNAATKPRIETTGNGDKVFDGETARQILEWAKKNARYMVVLDRRWDPQRNCWVEERAFTGGIRGSGGDKVSVSVGPSKTFCLNGTVYSAEQVNSTGDAIAKARELLAQALETDAKYEAYLKNNPNDANARNTFNVNRQWIDYYKKYIADSQNALANSIPPE